MIKTEENNYTVSVNENSHENFGTSSVTEGANGDYSDDDEDFIFPAKKRKRVNKKKKPKKKLSAPKESFDDDDSLEVFENFMASEKIGKKSGDYGDFGLNDDDDDLMAMFTTKFKRKVGGNIKKQRSIFRSSKLTNKTAPPPIDKSKYYIIDSIRKIANKELRPTQNWTFPFSTA